MTRLEVVKSTAAPKTEPLRAIEEVRRLYTRRADVYLAFNVLVGHERAVNAFFLSSDLLRPGLRILDAGCGAGTATLAARRAAARKGFALGATDAFDLTPAMLDRFRARMSRPEASGVRLCEADVLNLRTLPADWTGYDLVVSVAMLEYLPPSRLPEALAALRTRLASNGSLLLFISRRSYLTKLVIETFWHANRYTRVEVESALRRAGFTELAFGRFPRRFFLQNLWGHVVRANSPAPRGEAP